MCETCFQLFKAVDRLRKRELEIAWRLGILDDPNTLESIPEGILVVLLFLQLDGEPAINTRQAMRRPNQDNSIEENSEEVSLSKTMDHKQVKSSLVGSLIQKRPKARYKLLLVFEQLVEVSEEFFKTMKITLVYNFLGLEGKILLNPTNYNLEQKTITINKVRLYYFFADSISDVNDALRQKYVFQHSSNSPIIES